MRILGVAGLALLLGACSNAIVPKPGGYAPPAPGKPATTRPPASRPAAPRPTAASSGAGGVTEYFFDRKPTAGPIIAPMLLASPAPASPATAAQAGLTAGPAFASLPVSQDMAAAALAAFKISCPSVVRRTDASGLTRGEDWRPACDAAGSATPRDAKAFFERNFEVVQIADGKAFATGYYEPEIAGSRERRHGYETPIYGRPDDLVEVDLGQFSKDMAGKKIRGRVDGTSFVPYFDRTAIEQGALAGRGLEIGWAADPIELFFLQIQGSGRIRLPDGRVMRIGYASQNGRDYVGIGALMRDRGILPAGGASMQGIMGYLREHRAEGVALMRENKSYVFFKELTGPGPLGALGLPVTGEVSVAADPKFIPLGAPVFLSLDRNEASGLWIAQDTGGAIKGANRVDTFWGAGERARTIAGGMSGRGTAFLLLPAGTLARLQQRG